MTIAELRKLIVDIENKPAKTPGTTVPGDECLWSFGVDEIDQALPHARLCSRSFHDVSAAHPTDRSSACGFAMALLSRLPGEGDILWCQLVPDAQEYGSLYGPGLHWLGIDPGRIIHVCARSHKDLAWVMEEAVRSAGLRAVLSEGPALNFTATRRLSLACEEAATPCLFVNLNGEAGASAAATRWQVKADVGPGDGEGMSGPGTAAWSISLVRCRGGQPGKWHLHWDYETFSFHMASPVRGGEIFARPADTGDVVAFGRAG